MLQGLATRRVCSACGTILSRYNRSGSLCFAHDRPDDAVVARRDTGSRRR
jgi:hypothetical protein